MDDGATPERTDGQNIFMNCLTGLTYRFYGDWVYKCPDNLDMLYPFIIFDTEVEGRLINEKTTIANLTLKSA